MHQSDALFWGFQLCAVTGKQQQRLEKDRRRFEDVTPGRLLKGPGWASCLLVPSHRLSPKWIFSLSLSLSFSNYFPLPISGPGQVIVLPTSTTLLLSSLLQRYPLWFSYNLPLHLWTIYLLLDSSQITQLDSSISWLVTLTQSKDLRQHNDINVIEILID